MPVSLTQATDYYKNTLEEMVVVEQIVHRSCWDCEPIDTWIYELKDGELIPVGFLEREERNRING